MYKKHDARNKANHRPVSVLPLSSKIFKKIIYDQVYEYMKKRSDSELLYGLQEEHFAQHALFRLLPKWQT